ncbi:MAG TPA: carboxypeptidase regulatory-like domain-containing protein [Gemmatimonadaceae bacterium]|nr:carboxypeptidase regulatory-like domain-containing protein [Gemmatimonadaceae bacterium]
MTEFKSRRIAAVVLACSCLVACGKDAARTQKSGSRTTAVVQKTDDSAAGTVDLGGGSYKPGPVTSSGSLAGTIKLDGAAPAPVAIDIDQKICGTTAESPVTTSAKTGGLGGVVVWIANITTGKPFPIDKRAELSSEKCALDPRVQGVVVGTTVNVFNDDKLLHKLVFTPLGTHDTLTAMPFFNEGQVVASERLAKSPGIVEVRCVQHPWTHAYIAVFDHPYFDVTEDDGSFKIDSLPPGTYTVNLWHEGMAKPVTQSVNIAANGTARIDLPIKLQ